MFCGLIYFPLVNMNCLCITTVKYPLWNSGKTGSIILFLSICKPGMCDFFFLLSRYGNIFFFLIAVRTHIWKERGWIICECLVCLEASMWKRWHLFQTFRRGESAFYVVPSEKIMFCFFIYLRESELPSTGSLPECSQWPHLGAKPRSSIQASHMGGRNPNTWAITTASQGPQEQEAGVRNKSEALNPGTLIWDTGI